MGLGTAFRFLTILPFPARAEFSDRMLGRSAAWYPLVGAVIGAIVAVLAFGADQLFGALEVAALVVTIWIVLTRGLHLDGLADTCDGLGGGASPEQRLAIMKDSRVGAFGVIAIVLSVLLKFAFTAELVRSGGFRAIALAPIMGRWLMVVAIFVFPPAARSGLGATVKLNCRWPQLLIASATLLAAGWLLVRVWALPVAAAAAVAAGLLGWHCRRRLGGLTGDSYGAICELGEIVSLGAMAVLRHLQGIA